MRWVAFFSQTGSEILEVSKTLDRFPDVVLYNTNFGTKPPINIELITELNTRNIPLHILPDRPRLQDYKMILQEGDLITLHGWLRIIPPEICESFNIYNGHPGLITENPELKGQDPQKKAYELGLPFSGCVIHKVTAEVDAGEIVLAEEIKIEKLELDVIINVLHDTSIKLWVKFLEEKNENND